MKKLYFAYGSNMSQSRLEERVGKVKKIGTHMLFGYVISFNCGYDDNMFANIVPTGEVHDYVEGVVYELSLAQLKQLDQFEGAPIYYTRFVDRYRNRDLNVYISINPLYKPHHRARVRKEYLNYILNGCKENGLDARRITLRLPL